MNGRDLLEKLLKQYEGNFDIERDFDIDGYHYGALAAFNATSAKYVLMKKAELWRAHCYEYILFDVVDSLDVNHVEEIMSHVTEYVEPRLVRKGDKYPEKDHMYSYMTVIVMVDGEISNEAMKMITKAKMYINYKLAIRGYSELRLIAIDTTTGKIHTNKAAKKFRKEIKKLF